MCLCLCVRACAFVASSLLLRRGGSVVVRTPPTLVAASDGWSDTRTNGKHLPNQVFQVTFEGAGGEPARGAQANGGSGRKVMTHTGACLGAPPSAG